MCLAVSEGLPMDSLDWIPCSFSPWLASGWQGWHNFFDGHVLTTVPAGYTRARRRQQLSMMVTLWLFFDSSLSKLATYHYKTEKDYCPQSTWLSLNEGHRISHPNSTCLHLEKKSTWPQLAASEDGNESSSWKAIYSINMWLWGKRWCMGGNIIKDVLGMFNRQYVNSDLSWGVHKYWFPASLCLFSA